MLALWAALAALAQDPANGEYIARSAGCVACHTAEGGVPYAGGYPLKTKFGTWYGSNLTQDPETGIGTFTEADFMRSLREGRRPDGTPYWPAFPYVAFTLLTDQDMRDLYAYLQTIEPVVREEEPHEGIPGSGLKAWRMLEFRQGPFEPDPRRDDEWNRGAYLARAVGHCGECHTPRDAIHRRKDRQEFRGSDVDEGGPNITPHEDGIGGWTLDDLTTFLSTGMEPDGDFVGGVMASVVSDQTALMTPEDQRAMAVYLLAVEPRPSRKGDDDGHADE